MTSAVPAMLFSAAIPGQERNQYVNKQWLGYWRDLFPDRKLSMVDALRPRIRADPHIACYFRQTWCYFYSIASWRLPQRLVAGLENDAILTVNRSTWICTKNGCTLRQRT